MTHPPLIKPIHPSRCSARVCAGTFASPARRPGPAGLDGRRRERKAPVEFALRVWHDATAPRLVRLCPLRPPRGRRVRQRLVLPDGAAPGQPFLRARARRVLRTDAGAAAEHCLGWHADRRQRQHRRGGGAYSWHVAWQMRSERLQYVVHNSVVYLRGGIATGGGNNINSGDVFATMPSRGPGAVFSTSQIRL